MTRFAHVLQRAESTLSAPEPQRSRVLLELAQDLDDLFAELRAVGLTEDEAARRAEALLAPSPEAMSALARVHEPLHVRLAERYSPGSAHGVERALLGLIATLALLFAVWGLMNTSAFAAASPALWLLQLLVAAAAWHGGAVVLQVPGRRRARGAAEVTTSHMTALLWLAGFACVIGVTGAAVEIWRMAAVAQSGDAAVAEVWAYVGRAAEVLTFALALMLATLLVWFMAYRRVRRVTALASEISREEVHHD